MGFHRFNQRVFQQNRPVATNFSSGPEVSFRGEAEVDPAAEFAASVENDPSQTLVAVVRATQRTQATAAFAIFW